MTAPGAFHFHPVIELPKDYIVLDLSRGNDPRGGYGVWAVGKYNEKRAGMYTTPLFGGVRDIHMGVDIGGPVGTPIHAFDEGEIFMTAYNSAPGDYGYTIITRHRVEGRALFALHGHLQKRSIEGKSHGRKIRRGEVIAWIGDVHENGGWEHPHLHFQLGWQEPEACDMPGAVSDQDRAEALLRYPDPRMVLGPLY